MTTASNERLFERFRRDFLGLETTNEVATLDGASSRRRRIYLDATATSLMPRIVWDSWRAYFDEACANSHTRAHLAGRATTEAIERSRVLVGELFGYDPRIDAVIFTGNGATGAVNLLADAIFPAAVTQLFRHMANPATSVREAAEAMVETLRAERSTIVDRLPRDLVVVSKMEHHSNMLPWIRAVGYERVRFANIRRDGTLDIDHLRTILDRDGPRVRVVAVTGVSNVTGIINPVHDLARMAHAAGAQIVIDAAQAAPHVPITMHPENDAESALDYVIVSGHKLYAPGSRGALVGRADVFQSGRVVGYVGGGAVEYVSTEEVRFKSEATDREEAGTPNIPGTIALGIVAKLLKTIGMETVRDHETALVRDALARLTKNPEVVVYGATDCDRVPRAGVIAFNLRALPHGLVAAALSDYFNIAVRNDCFCAQPYVKEQLRNEPDVESACTDDFTADGSCDVLRRPGMVRASFGVFTTHEDIAALDEAVKWIATNAVALREQYVQTPSGDWQHRSHGASARFAIDDLVTRYANASA
jgi:selenocysteine lyase/cysteine desulfurase